MYLFVYGNYADVDECFEIVGGYSDKEALTNFYEKIGGYKGIDSDLFLFMIRNLPFTQAVGVFNALRPMEEIKRVFSGLTEVKIKDGKQDGK